MKWVKVTTYDGVAVWINLDLFVTMRRAELGTELYDLQGDRERVRETPEQLIDQARKEATVCP